MSRISLLVTRYSLLVFAVASDFFFANVVAQDPPSHPLEVATVQEELTKASDSPLDPEKSMSLKWERIKSEPIQLNASLNKLVAEIPLDLGECFSDREIPIRFLLKNELGISVEFEQVTTSCGCLAGVPANINLENNEVLPIRLLLKVPRELGDFGKTISVLDKETGCHLKFLLKGKSKPYVSLEQYVFPIMRTGKMTFETTLKLNMAGFRSDELIFSVDKVREVVGYRVIPEGEFSAKLILELEVAEGTEDFHVGFNVHANSWDKLYSTDLQFPAAYKPSSRPKTLALRRSDDGKLSGKLLVQMVGLPNEGTHQLVGRVIADSGETQELMLSVSYRRLNDLLRFTEISIDKLNVPDGSKVEIEFVAGDLRLIVSVSVF